VACDCGMQDRAMRVMDRARIPKRYEHCDFESYVTDLTDGKTWTAQARAVIETGETAHPRIFSATIPAPQKKDCCS